jgi:hypothetical protein
MLLQVLSQIPETGVIFSDSIEKDVLICNSGKECTAEVADIKEKLVY